jgi:hypothetical protein
MATTAAASATVTLNTSSTVVGAAPVAVDEDAAPLAVDEDALPVVVGADVEPAEVVANACPPDVDVEMGPGAGVAVQDGPLAARRLAPAVTGTSVIAALCRPKSCSRLSALLAH